MAVLTKFKISLSIPGADRPDRYFSLRLKQTMDNEPSEYDQPKKIFAISDIEGNFQPFCKLLIKNKVVNRYLDWTFGDGHLMIAGDCFDRGEQVTECLWLIYSLEEKAKRKGGHVHFILGNHEIMNLNGDWRYVHPKYSTRRSTALYSGNNELWNWLRTKNIMEKIGSVLFVHGGIAPALNELPYSISDINNMARPYYTYIDHLFTNPLLALLFNSKDSPFWYRDYYNDIATEQLIDATLAKFGVSTIVTGHTVIEQVTGYFNNKVININTDHAVPGKSQGLMIRKQHFYRMTMEGKRIRIK